MTKNNKMVSSPHLNHAFDAVCEGILAKPGKSSSPKRKGSPAKVAPIFKKSKVAPVEPEDQAMKSREEDVATSDAEEDEGESEVDEDEDADEAGGTSQR